MNHAHSFKLGYFSASVIMGLYVLQVISASSPSVDSPHHSFVAFASAPDKVVDGSAVWLRYHCSGPCQLGVDVLATTLQETDLVIFRKKWINSAPRGIGIHQVLLRFPPSILYQRSFYNKVVLEVGNVTLRAWMDHKGSSVHPLVTVSKQLQITPHSERPIKPPTGCPSWPSLLMWQINTSRLSQCQQDADQIDMLKFPLASTGEGFGVVRRVRPFIDRDLERERHRAVTEPRAALSMWVYLVEWCQEKQCAIFHHLNRKNVYDSPLIQLSDAGGQLVVAAEQAEGLEEEASGDDWDVVIQAHLTEGEDEAFRTNVALPLWKWIRLDCYIVGSKVQLEIVWAGRSYVSEYEFHHNIYFDDTDGHFIIGGSRYVPSIHGYFGPIKYHRFGVKKIMNALSPKDLLMGLGDIHSQCNELKNITTAYLQEVTESQFLSPVNKGVCTPHFIKLRSQFAKKTCKQTWSWEAQQKHSIFFNFLQTRDEQLQKEYLSLKNLRSGLFEEGLGAMFTEDQVEINMTAKMRALLQTASCFGNHKASLLLATIHLSGLGHSVDLLQGHIYSLIGALGDDRFALMHAGYKHTQGIDGFPEDFDMTYGYYSNVAAQSIKDAGKIYQSTYILEQIYLWNHKDLDQREIAGTDMLDYLKYQAERGDTESQKLLGAMLYWGQSGISKDILSGVKWIERSAMQMSDPAAMYDYSIFLIKGQGVKRNYTRALDLLNKAAAMGSINALNGLGWYHGIILNDHKSAVKYFEQAAFNGSEEGMFNLGIYHLSGTIPDGLQRNETAAFFHFLNASELGHAAASVEAAHYLSTGSLEGVSQDVERAVIMLKKVCERNGHLGFMIREALEAYLQGSWQEAFVKYVLAAETGLGLAQSNVAYLCEELNLGYDCQWRYQNYSILNYDPHPSALLKMGDYFYESSSAHQDSLSLVGRAVWMYSRAALAGSPQGMFNLFILVQQGHSLPLSVQVFFNVSRHDKQDAVVEKILTRCVESAGEEEEEGVPCVLALLGVQMGKALRSMSQSGAQRVLICASFLSLCVIIVTVPLKMCLEQRRPGSRVVAPGARTSSVSQDGININTGQNGIVGGPYIPAGSLRIIIQNGGHWLSRTGDLALTLAGLCLCVFWTTLLYHLL